MNDPSAGEIGGIFAGIVGLLVAMGHAIKWWLGWTDRRAATRAAKLEAWHRELVDERARLDNEKAEIIAEIKGQLAANKAQLDSLTQSNDKLEASNGRLREQVTAVLAGFRLVAAALHASDPYNPALGHANEIFKAAFPLEMLLSPELAAAAAKLDKTD